MFRKKINTVSFCLKQRKNKSSIISPLQIDGPQNIHIEKNVLINYKTWLASMPLTETTAELIIREGSTIGHFCHIYSTRHVEIGKNVLIADKVYISDNMHGYEEINVPIIKQPVVQKNQVIIGDDSWIGENVCIIGACIGKHCIVGANSVVTHDFPDYCVVAGVPAKIIKKYNHESGMWERVNE